METEEADKDKQIKGEQKTRPNKVHATKKSNIFHNVRCENINDTKIGVNVCFPQGKGVEVTGGGGEQKRRGKDGKRDREAHSELWSGKETHTSTRSLRECRKSGSHRKTHSYLRSL